MATILLLAIIGVHQVFSQAVHSSGSFTYQGCSAVDLSCFGDPIVFSDGRLTPETCQLACQDHQFAALFPDSCRCSDDPKAVRPEDEGKCDHACMGDHNLGMCGSVCPENGPGIANVYTRSTPRDDSPGNGGPSGSQSPPASVETPCSSTETTPPTQTITPEGQPPEVPTPLGSPPVGSPVPTGSPVPGYSQTPVPQEPSCSSREISTPNTPVPPTQDPQTPPGSAPAPKTISSQPQPAPGTTITPRPPGYSPECQSVPPTPYSDNSNNAPGGGPGDPSEGSNCKLSGGPDLSPIPSVTTLWPSPSRNRPDGDPPVPSQVPGSDSTHGIVPPFSNIGGLALLAVLFI